MYLRKGAKNEAQRTKVKQKIKTGFDALISAVPDGTYHTWILSAEQLYSLDPLSILDLKNYLQKFARNIRVLFDIREHVACAVSQRSMLARFGRIPHDDLINHKSFYVKILKNWLQAFDRENIEVRIFDRNLLLGGDIVSDFLSVVRIQPNTGIEGSRANPALSDIGVRLLSKIRKQLPGFIDDEPNPTINHAGQAFEKHLNKGPSYSPSENEISVIEALYQDDDHWVLDNFFPDRNILFERHCPKEVAPLDEDELLDQIAAAIVEIQSEIQIKSSHHARRYPWKYIFPAIKMRLRK